MRGEMMDPVQRALLKAIADMPDDLNRRRIYADWLEENGHEVYADFIRHYCEQPNTTISKSRLLKNEGLHHYQNVPHKIDEFLPGADVADLWAVHAGMMTEWGGDRDSWFAHGPEIVLHHPGLAYVELVRFAVVNGVILQEWWPQDLINKLKSGSPTLQGTYRYYRTYAVLSDAEEYIMLDDISQACIAWAKEQNG